MVDTVDIQVELAIVVGHYRTGRLLPLLPIPERRAKRAALILL
jgi:hypothetical protein